MDSSPFLICGDDLFQMAIAQQPLRLRRRKLCLQGCNWICNLPACRRAKLACCVIGLVQKLAKLLCSLELLTQTFPHLTFSCFALCQAEAFFAKKLICFDDASVLASQVLAKLLNLRFMPSFRLKQQVLKKMLNLSNTFRDEGIEPADGSWKQIRFGKLLSVGDGHCPSSYWRCLGNQSAINIDYFRSDAGIDQVLDREMSVAPSRLYQRRRVFYGRVRQTN